MIVKLALGLRNNAQRVEVIKSEDSIRPILGTTHPQEDNRRRNVQRQWGDSNQQGRPQSLASITEPLSQRAQTILSYRVDPQLRQRLATGMGTVIESRKRSNEAKTTDLQTPE